MPFSSVSWKLARFQIFGAALKPNMNFQSKLNLQTSERTGLPFAFEKCFAEIQRY
jgi:hypothetical protein